MAILYQTTPRTDVRSDGEQKNVKKPTKIDPDHEKGLKRTKNDSRTPTREPTQQGKPTPNHQALYNIANEGGR